MPKRGDAYDWFSRKGAWLPESINTDMKLSPEKLSTELPLYEEIRRNLQARIETGELREGDRIVPEIELAKQLGVSRSTARKALQCLTDDGFISRTAGRGSFVLPRRVREGMPGGRVLELAVCSAEVNGAGSELARGFLMETLAAGCAAIAWPWNGQAQTWPRGASGCALWAAGNRDLAQVYYADAQSAGLPLALIDSANAYPGCDAVNFDQEGVAMALVESLVALKHQSIALVTGPMPNHVLDARVAGFRAAMRAAGLDTSPELQITGMLGHAEELQRSLLGLFARRERATALVCVHEGLSPWIVEAILRLGYTPGRDLDLGLVVDAPIKVNATCAQVDMVAAGRAAARMLLRRIEEPGLTPQEVTVGHILL